MADFEAAERNMPVPRAEAAFNQPGNHGGAARLRMARAVNMLTDAQKRKNTYAYKNINYDQDIRILKIYPGAPGAPLICCLVPCSLLDQNSQLASNGIMPIPYAALSYYWGEDEPDNKVYIFDTDRAYEDWRSINKTDILLSIISHMYIRNNLRDALEQLRSEVDPVYLWADALCINQNHVKERTAQVARMHDVYTQAEKVYIWLGEGQSADNQKAFDFLHKILDLQHLEQLVERLERKGDDGAWEADRQDCKRTIDLMKVKWFSRRWVIQELALATNAHVRRGHCEMPWLEFADAIALFMTKFNHIRRAFGAAKDYSASRNSDDHHISVLDARALGANALVTATSNLFRKSSEGKILQRLLSLEFLVSSMLLAFEASDPKDTVFAVLQLAKDIPVTGQEKQSNTIAAKMFTLCLAPLFGIVLWIFDTSTLPLPGAKRSSMSDISPRNTSLSAGIGMVIVIEYFMVALSMLLVWLICRMLLDIFVKAHLSIMGKSQLTRNRDKRIEANYRKCLRDVCADFIEYCIEDSRSLDILCRHWAPQPSPQGDMVSMPSWILPISGHAFGGPEQSQKSRVNGDSFVGGSERSGHYYTASGNLYPSFKFGKTKEHQEILAEEIMPEPGNYTKLPLKEKQELPPRFDGTLKVKGFQLGIIEKTAPMVGGVISRTALELCGWSKETGTSDLEQVWRILVANRGPNGSNPPNWYRRACRACLEWYKTEPEDTFNTNNLKDLPGTPAGKVEFLDRVQQVVWNRNIIRTRSTLNRSFTGIAPQESQKHDIICILFGCSVPVVLQPQDNGGFRFIGECYVYGVMDGEAVDPIPSGSREQWFMLH